MHKLWPRPPSPPSSPPPSFLTPPADTHHLAPPPPLLSLCLPAISLWRNPVAMSLSFSVAELAPSSVPRCVFFSAVPYVHAFFFFMSTHPSVALFALCALCLNTWFVGRRWCVLRVSNLFACPCQARFTISLCQGCLTLVLTSVSGSWREPGCWVRLSWWRDFKVGGRDRKTYREWGREGGSGGTAKTTGWASTISRCFDFITFFFFFFFPSARETAPLASLTNELHPASHQVAEI